MTKTIKYKDTEAVREKTGEVLKSGGVVIVPTDTVYGLACDSGREEACRRIYEIKGRAAGRPLALFLADRDDIGHWAQIENDRQRAAIDRLLPGPVTVLLKSKSLRPMVSPEGTIGIRIPDVPFLAGLIRRLTSPLATTSANLSGHAELGTAAALKKEFARTVDLVVAGPALAGPPSTVVNLVNEPPTVVRKGALGVVELESAIGRTVKLAPGVSFSVLIVCTGNLCRSPMARGILKELVGDRPVVISSAGTDTSDGLPATPYAVEAARARGADISLHHSSPLTREMVEASDLVLVMNGHHYDRVVGLVPRARAKTRFLRSYETAGREEIDDPIGGTPAVYQETARIIERSLGPVARDINNRF